MLADLLQEVAELKRTIEKNEKILLKKSYWENHLSIKIEKLQEENKNLKEENKKLKADTEHTIKFNNKIIGKLKLENDKLKEKLSEITMVADDEKQSIEHILELEQENKNLKSDLDKFSEAYKRYRDYEKEELAESCYDLARENEKLKEEIGKLVMNGK